MANQIAIFVLALCVLGLALAGRDDHSDQVKQSDLYCEMTEIYVTTNGEFGWPDFRGVRENECK